MAPKAWFLLPEEPPYKLGLHPLPLDSFIPSQVPGQYPKSIHWSCLPGHWASGFCGGSKMLIFNYFIEVECLYAAPAVLELAI